MVTIPVPEAVRTFFMQPNVAVLATISRSGWVQATPVWFMHVNNHILINARADRVKMRNMESNPHVALVILDGANPYRYVQIQGSVSSFDRNNGARDVVLPVAK